MAAMVAILDINEIILAILNLNAPRCLPSSFPSIQLTVWEQITIEDLQDSRRRCCSKIFKKADNFSNSESLCRFDASNQVLTQSDL